MGGFPQSKIGIFCHSYYSVDVSTLQAVSLFIAAQFFRCAVWKTVLPFALYLWCTIHKVMDMQFKPFVLDRMDWQVPVLTESMRRADVDTTQLPPAWQTSWTSEYLTTDRFEKYAAKANDELIALGAYEVLTHSLVVHIVYMEAHPESNPTMDGGEPAYRGIGRLMIAYGDKLSTANGFAGDVVLEAKRPVYCSSWRSSLPSPSTTRQYSCPSR